jgi:tetraacyldisaccharide 4'-kinase
MQAQLRNFLAANWYGDRRWTLLLLPLAWIFALLTALRRRAYRSGLFAVPDIEAPVIVVGNIAIGGTGKTPIVAWLVTRLVAAGRRPGIVSRGYGGPHARRPVAVTAQTDPALVGDEPVWLAQQTGCPVCVCVDRVAAVTTLLEAGIDVVVADDGLQHYRLHRDMEIVVVDAARGLGNGQLLPAGPLRESGARLAEVDCVLLNGAGAPVPGIRFDLEPRRLVAVPGGERRDLTDFAGCRVWMVAGIGNPARFEALLNAADIRTDAVPVPDHGRVSLESLHRRQPQPILMTAKDAIKYRDNRVENCWYLPVTVVFDPDDEARIVNAVSDMLSGWTAKVGEPSG